MKMDEAFKRMDENCERARIRVLFNYILPAIEDDPYKCVFCGKKLKSLKRMNKHILTHEGSDEFDSAVFQELSSSLLSNIDWTKKEIIKFFGKKEENYMDAKSNFLKNFDLDPTHSLEWRSDDLTIATEMFDHTHGMWKGISTFIENPDWLEKTMEIFDDKIERMTDKLLNDPYKHNSTSLMANAINQWKIEGQSKLLGSGHYSSIYSLKSIYRILEDASISAHQLSEL